MLIFIIFEPAVVELEMAMNDAAILRRASASSLVPQDDGLQVVHALLGVHRAVVDELAVEVPKLQQLPLDLGVMPVLLLLDLPQRFIQQFESCLGAVGDTRAQLGRGLQRILQVIQGL